MAKDGDMSEDELARAEKEIDALTQRTEAQIDESLAQKETELLED
jgi:ribosome recycling factor